MTASPSDDQFPIGSKLPSFSLTSTTGENVTDGYLRGGKASLVVFSCNHCPYVKGSEEMLIETVRKFEKDGLKTVSISSNDAIAYPDDGLEQMKEKTERMNLPYPYLFDKTQEVAKKFFAACTPECFLFDTDGALVFHGAINSNPRNPDTERTNHIELAIVQVLEGKKADPAYVHPLGCTIKWKQP